MRLFRFLLNNDSGATAVEYAVIAGVLSLAIVGGFTGYQQELIRMFNGITDAYVDANGSHP